MERDKVKDAEPSKKLGTRPNGRSTAALVINRDGPRKSLFTGLESTDSRAGEDARNAPGARPVSSGSSSSRGPSSPRTTKIPRPAQQALTSGRKPFSLKDAYRMATREEEAAAQGSPSPAPRSWRSRTTSEEKKHQKSPSKRSSVQGWRQRGTKIPTRSLERDDTMSPVDGFESGSQLSEVSGSDIDRKLKQFEKDQLRRGSTGVTEEEPGLLSKRELRAKGFEPRTQRAGTARNNSLGGRSPPKGYEPWGVKAKSERGWLRRVMASPEASDHGPESGREPSEERDVQHSRRVSSPSSGIPGGGESPATPISDVFPNPESRHPDKGFAWQADEDFTAGDLQVSQSPPVKAGSSTNPLRKEEEMTANEEALESNRSKTRNTKLDEIRALEIEAALKFPDEGLGRADEEDDIQEFHLDDKSRLRLDRHIRGTNKKIDEIRAREAETQSRRSLAAARLEEIRQVNAESRSRSLSPEVPPKPSNVELSQESTPLAEVSIIEENNANPVPAEDGERIPNTPITVFRKYRSALATKDGDGATRSTSQPSQGRDISRNDSHDLLRLLARAASNSPASEQQSLADEVKDPRRSGASSDKGETGNGGKERKLDRAGEEIKPRVGFAGLQREPSVESDKRSSLALSDADPEARIVGELQLFAPGENHSERGSLRAPSPDPEEEFAENEETPKPPRVDPLTQPTPRVTGAYVETPATIKSENVEDDVPMPQIVQPEGPKAVSGISSLFRGRRAESSPRKPFSARGDREPPRSLSLPRGRRSRSLPRARSPLMNSARPPTVRDDLLEIHRAHQIEDSTLDDFSELLGVTADPSPQTKEESNANENVKVEEVVPQDFISPNDDRDDEFKTFARMNKALTTGLLGIRTAKRGIERLEDKVSHAGTRPKSEATHGDDGPASLTKPSPPNALVTYIQIPLPRLWRRQPRFKLTLLGTIVFLASLWYVAESAMCSLYCKPEACYPGQPCDWSPDDPFWGYSIPVKLDQWTTGGKGKALVNLWAPDVADWKADLWDAITGTDFTKVDTSGFSWEQRKQHRRRLMKRGLVRPPVESPEDRVKHQAWRAAAAAKEKADAMREMGYDADEDESMARDEKVSW